MVKRMKIKAIVFAAALLGTTGSSYATGVSTCDSGAKDGWQPQEKLTAMLKDKGWQVRRIKVDGDCYEAYGTDEKGKRFELYFHPRTLAPVPPGSKGFKG
jgi:hypothetical protein